MNDDQCCYCCSLKMLFHYCWYFFFDVKKIPISEIALSFLRQNQFFTFFECFDFGTLDHDAWCLENETLFIFWALIHPPGLEPIRGPQPLAVPFFYWKLSKFGLKLFLIPVMALKVQLHYYPLWFSSIQSKQPTFQCHE